MDFTYKYTEQQEKFRKEVRTWLDEMMATIPEEMKEPVDPDDFTEEQYSFWQEQHKELAKKGWLYPTFPKEYGGGGLTADHDAILQEELERAGFYTRFPSSTNVLGALAVWATEEQKQKFLVPLLKGEQASWQKFTEPKSGADLASYQSRAVRDGDDWIINGSNVFVSRHGAKPDYLWGPALTDPEAPRHRNLGFFMIPCPSPGLEIKPLRLVQGKDQHFVFLDNVRVPGDHLIGGDHQGWQVANTVLEEEHGGAGRAYPSNPVVDNLVKFMAAHEQQDQSPGGDPVVQQKALDAYLEARIDRVFKLRTNWMYVNRKETTWEGPTQFYFQRTYGFRNVARVRDVMGMYALLGTHDPLAPYGGAQEVDQRTSFIHQHGAGSLNITKVVVARRIGISRTTERAAPTRMTAGGHSS